MFSGQSYEKQVSVRERNVKLLLETVTYIAPTSHLHNCNRNSMCIMHCSTTCMIVTETSTCITSIKIVFHVFVADAFTCINGGETFNCIISTETVTCIFAMKRSTKINVAESTTDIIAMEPQKLHNCNRCWHLHNCYRKCQLHSSSRNCHLQN